MFDVFGHVFGRKSTKTSGQSQQSSQDGDAFEFVGETASDRSTVSSNHNQLADPVPPYPGGAPIQNSMPYGLAPTYDISQQAKATFSPLENVPFSLHPNLRVAEEMKKSWVNVSHCLAAIDKYKDLEIETNYSFELENTVLNEISHAQL